MAKRKRSEEDAGESNFCADAGKSAAQIDATVGSRNGSLDGQPVRGWAHREVSSEGSLSSPVLVVTIKLRREDSWEAEAFWTLLANARYTDW